MFANTFFGGLPEGTFEMSKAELQLAVKLAPNDIYHELELGKTYEIMDKDAKAAEAYRKVLELPIVDHRDSFYQEEARDLLKDL